MNSRNNPDIAIVGGGIAGLSLAYFLGKRGYRVTLFEKRPVPGGQLRAFEVGRTRLECFYHHIFWQDRQVLALVRELRLEKYLRWVPSRVGYLKENSLYGFSKVTDLMKFKPLPLFQKLRFGWGTVRARYSGSTEGLLHISSPDWLKRKFGEKGYREIWKPLLENKFGAEKENIPAAWIKGKIRQRSSSRKNIFAPELLGYMDGSFLLLAERLHQAVAGMDHEVFLGEEVLSARWQGNRWLIGTPKRFVEAEVLISTIAMPYFRAILPPDFTMASGPEYLDVRCLIVFSSQQLSPFYWLNIDRADLPFHLVVEHTNLIPPVDYGGRHIIYMSQYGKSGLFPEDVFSDDEEKKWIACLSELFPHFEEGAVTESKSFMERYAVPVFKIESSWSPWEDARNRLYILNNENSYPYDRSIDQTVGLAWKLARGIDTNLGQGNRHKS